MILKCPISGSVDPHSAKTDPKPCLAAKIYAYAISLGYILILRSMLIFVLKYFICV